MPNSFWLDVPGMRLVDPEVAVYIFGCFCFCVLDAADDFYHYPKNDQGWQKKEGKKHRGASGSPDPSRESRGRQEKS
jgi:hypothetical protein